MACDLKTFTRYIHELLKVDRFQDVLVNGLQVEGKKKIVSIATAVTSSLYVIKQAHELKADALICHHGLFLHGKDSLVLGTMKEKLRLLLEEGISLLTYHLPLDAHEEVGNNWAVAKSLGWHNTQPFGIHTGVSIGVKANFAPIERQKLEKLLKKFYNSDARSVLGGKEVVSSCGIISGGAHKFIVDAIDAELDCFVTGTADEPTWHQAQEGKINFFAFGHAATEKIGVQLLGNHLSKHFGVKHHFIDENNPF